MALACATWGLDARDLAGEEINMLRGSPGDILAWSMDPRGGFTGHLPWSYWLRWASLSVFGDDAAWAWRLPAAAAAVGAASLTWWAARGPTGLIAGLVVALNPILAFHSHDASNYSWTALVGALLLAGLLGLPKRGWGLLGAGFLIGVMNDFYTAIAGGGALLAAAVLAWRAGTMRQLALACAPAALVALPAGAVFAWRLLDAQAGGVLHVHADPLPPRSLPLLLDVPWRVLNRTSGAYLWGYEAGRIDALWASLPPVLLTVACLVARSRAAAMVAAGLGISVVAGVLFQLASARVFPYEPRVYIGLLPALALCWTQGLLRLPKWAAIPAVSGLLFQIGTTTWAQLRSTGDLRAWAATQVETIQDDVELVIADGLLAARATTLPSELPVRDCLEPGDRSRRLAWVADHGVVGQTLPMCGNPDVDTPPPPTPPFTIVSSEVRDPPAHERNSASFQPARAVALVSLEPVEAAAPQTIQIRVEPAPFDGRGSGALQVVADGERGPKVLWTGPPEGTPVVDLPVDIGTPVHLILAATAPPWVPGWTLFDPYRRHIQRWEPRPRAWDRQWTIRMNPLQAPGWVVATRLLRAALALAALVGLALGRRRG